jgi:hypothetical protein
MLTRENVAAKGTVAVDTEGALLYPVLNGRPVELSMTIL